MFPLWFFLVLIAVICYLLYATRTTQDDILLTGKSRFKRIQFHVKENRPDK